MMKNKKHAIEKYTCGQSSKHTPMVAPSGSVGVAAGEPLCTFFMKGLLRWPLQFFDFGEVLLSENMWLMKAQNTQHLKTYWMQMWVINLVLVKSRSSKKKH